MNLLLKVEEFKNQQFQIIPDIKHSLHTANSDFTIPETVGTLVSHERFGPYQVFYRTTNLLHQSRCYNNCAMSDGTIVTGQNHRLKSLRKFKIPKPDQHERNLPSNEKGLIVLSKLTVHTKTFVVKSEIHNKSLVVDKDNNVWVCFSRTCCVYNKKGELIDKFQLKNIYIILHLFNKNKLLCFNFNFDLCVAYRNDEDITLWECFNVNTISFFSTVYACNESSFLTVANKSDTGLEEIIRKLEISTKQFIELSVQLKLPDLEFDNNGISQLVGIPNCNAFICLFTCHNPNKNEDNRLLCIFTEAGECVYYFKFRQLYEFNILPVNKDEIYLMGNNFMYSLMSL